MNSNQLKNFLLFFLLITTASTASGQLFDQPERMALVRKGTDHIYNVQVDSAQHYITLVSKELPGHPAVSMMQALLVLWEHVPLVTIDTIFNQFSGHLEETVRRAMALDGGQQKHPEAIFFEMSARGLMAEYHADAGSYVKAVSEANKAYGLIKKGFDLSEEIPEFLLTTGVYNYFREKYPEKHPVYKPFLWFFRSGDIELGLEQVRMATRRAVLTKVEAYIYLAYIYLRYEEDPRAAQSYLWKLTELYPQNRYIQCKLLESLVPDSDIRRAPYEMIEELAKSDRPYYQMAGEIFWGLYEEKVKANDESALLHYRKGISAGSTITGHGELYRSLAYLGLGRIHHRRGNTQEAVYYLEKSLEYAETEDITEEASVLLGSL